MQPVTMTLPFSASASPIASSDSACALSRKPQVLTMTRSAPLCSRDKCIALGAQPRDDALAESTSALGQPSETKLTEGRSRFRGVFVGHGRSAIGDREQDQGEKQAERCDESPNRCRAAGRARRDLGPADRRGAERGRPQAYRPGLGDLMTMTVQPRHIKIALGGPRAELGLCQI